MSTTETDWTDYTSSDLARIAGCVSPSVPDRDALGEDNPDASPGALYLRAVENATKEMWGDFQRELPRASSVEILKTWVDQAVSQEAVAEAVPSDDSLIVHIFADLEAWREDLSAWVRDNKTDPLDLSSLASVAVRQIGERLAFGVAANRMRQTTEGIDTLSSASRQHFIETGEYLPAKDKENNS